MNVVNQDEQEALSDVSSFAAVVAKLHRQGGDDAEYEAKACAQGLGSAVWESVSAFANTSGGTLILGLDEKAGFAPAKGFNLDRIRDQFVEGIGDGGKDGSKVTPSPRYQMRREELGTAQVLVIRIDENSLAAKPCYVTAQGKSNGSYKRVDDKDVRLSPAEIFELEQVLTPSDVDRDLVPEATRDDLDDELVQALIRKKRGTRALKNVTGEAAQLSRLNIMSKDGGIRLAGLLSIGVYPQQFFPGLVIDVAVHPGRKKSTPREPRFLDRIICDGPLAEAIDTAVESTVRNLRSASVVEAAGRREVPEIPAEVLREAIANAVVHREYHPLFIGQPVAVDVYLDRLEVTSPGGLWGGKTPQNIDDGTSRCRNQTLAQIMRDVQLRSGEGTTFEGEGTGIALMVREMETRGLRRPSFHVSMDQVVVELQRQGKAVAQSVNPSDAGGLSDRMVEVLSAVDDDSPKSVREIAEATGLGLAALRKTLRELVERDLLTATAAPTSRNRKYLRRLSR